MVTVLLSGGLGNQMFQYAAGKSLANRLNTHLIINTYALDKRTQTTTRNFELDIFGIHPSLQSSLRSKFAIKARPFITKHKSLFQKLGFFSDGSAIVFVPEFNLLKGNVILNGYFQNEKYFESSSENIREEFTFQTPLDGINENLSELISATESVAVHIRRGDYITDTNAANNFVTCDRFYYEQAIRYIKERVVTPTFFVFSEDMQWVKEQIDFGESAVQYIDWNKGTNSYRDLQLMSLCKNIIIANSSFSWWAAWLNKNPEKIVLTPSRWFKDENRNNKELDQFYPKGWTKI